MATHSVFLPGKFHGQRRLAATVNRIAESDTTKHTHTQCPSRDLKMHTGGFTWPLQFQVFTMRQA